MSASPTVTYVIDKRDSEAAAPKQKRAYFCISMIALNVVVFIYSLKLNNWKLEPESENPMFGPPASVLRSMGAKDTYLIVNCGEWWRNFTAIGLHCGIIHILFNMWALWDVGSSLERHFGSLVVAVIYVLSGAAGNAASCIFLPEIMSVGASGAIFGLFGAMWSDFILNYHVPAFRGNRCSTLFCLLLSTVISLAIGLMPFVDNFAHIGGFIAGLLCGLVLLADRSDSKREGICCTAGIRQKLVGFIAGVALLTYVIVLYTSLYENHNIHSWCSFCEKVNCLETKWWDCDVDTVDEVKLDSSLSCTRIVQSRRLRILR